MKTNSLTRAKAVEVFEELSDEDRKAITKRGISNSDILFQIANLLQPEATIELVRAATLGDGVRALPAAQDFEKFEEAVAGGRASAFVPASGDATRMFESLYKVNRLPDLDEAALAKAAEGGDGDAAEALTALRNIKDFALWSDLERLGCDPRDWRGILGAMLSPHRLAVGQMPKGLLPFHAYGAIARTAVEEHCHSILALGFGRIHFTIKADAVDRLMDAASKVSSQAGCEDALAVSYSFQKTATDTICLADCGLHRDGDGAIVFRAGGHGSLLTNLMDTGGDIVFLRNIDNIVVEERFPTINDVRRRMCELLLRIEAKVHGALRRLTDDGDLGEAIEVLTNDLGLTIPGETQSVEYYIEQLNRPIRVCGVIKAKGDVGGGVYWTKDPGDISRVQIVEGAQLSYSDDEQLAIARRLAYFNPVDMVCSIRDFRGAPFDLCEFRDDDAIIITKKSRRDQSILAYEHPGLWNGGMARWNSVFVEVPAETFQPVKRFSDLLSPFHRSEV